jgi:hypothetical protein
MEANNSSRSLGREPRFNLGYEARRIAGRIHQMQLGFRTRKSHVEEPP